MSCDDCKEDKLTFSVLLQPVEPVQIKSRYDPTPAKAIFDEGWIKLCVDCIQERQKKALFQGEIGNFIGFNHEEVSK